MGTLIYIVSISRRGDEDFDLEIPPMKNIKILQMWKWNAKGSKVRSLISIFKGPFGILWNHYFKL